MRGPWQDAHVGRIKDILGYEKDEVAGQSIAKIFHPDYIEKARACLNEILVDGLTASTTRCLNSIGYVFMHTISENGTRKLKLL